MNQHEIERIKELIDEGYITRRKHPELELYILNYTSKTQYEDKWEYATEHCRGLITDENWNIISKSFKKFYNLDEKMSIDELPDETPMICEKLDGFLGIMYNENGFPAIATRGSFESPMAIWATEWIHNTLRPMSDFLHGFTYVFEIINPVLCREEGMIVNYGQRSECVLLAVIETATELELDHVSEAKDLGLPFAKVYTGSLSDAISEIPLMRATEQEGYVCRYSNGLRIKLKADEYKKIHRLLSRLTPKRILNVLIESGHDGLEKMLGDIPDESYDRVRRMVDKIYEEQQRLTEEGWLLYESTEHMCTDAERATVIHRAPNNAVAFAMLNERDYGDIALIALKGVRKVIRTFDE